MSLLSDYISLNRSFPIKHTGLSNRDDEVNPWYRKKNNIHYNCSFCGADIGPEEYLDVHIDSDHLVPRIEQGMFGGPDTTKYPYEVLGFTCNVCREEITEYDMLYYG